MTLRNYLALVYDGVSNINELTAEQRAEIPAVLFDSRLDDVAPDDPYASLIRQCMANHPLTNN